MQWDKTLFALGRSHPLPLSLFLHLTDRFYNIKFEKSLAPRESIYEKAMLGFFQIFISPCNDVCWRHSHPVSEVVNLHEREAD